MHVVFVLVLWCVCSVCGWLTWTVVIFCVYVKIKELVWSFFFSIRAAEAFARIRFLFQAPVCTCTCEEAPLDVTRHVFTRDLANYSTRLVSSLSPCPTEPTEQRRYCTKGKRFYSQFVPFILYRGKVRKSRVVSRAYGKRDDLLDAGGSGGKENRRFECFLSSLSLHSFGLFFHFSRKKVIVTLRRQLFSSLTRKCSPSSHLLHPERTSSKFGMRPSRFVCPPFHPCGVFSSHTEGSRGTHFIHTPQRL